MDGAGRVFSDVDECAVGTERTAEAASRRCPAAATCQNTVGSFVCRCSYGYYGDSNTCHSQSLFRLSKFPCYTGATMWPHDSIHVVIYRMQMEMFFYSAKTELCDPYCSSVILPFVCLAVSRMDNSRTRYGCRPTMVGMDKGWPSRSDLILVLSGSGCGSRISFSFLALADWLPIWPTRYRKNGANAVSFLVVKHVLENFAIFWQVK